jgi:hypothetical protein
LAAHLDEGGGRIRTVDGDDEILARLALAFAEGRFFTRSSQSGTVSTCSSPFSSQRRSAEGWKIAAKVSALPSYRPSK